MVEWQPDAQCTMVPSRTLPLKLLTTTCWGLMSWWRCPVAWTSVMACIAHAAFSAPQPSGWQMLEQMQEMLIASRISSHSREQGSAWLALNMKR